MNKKTLEKVKKPINALEAFLAVVVIIGTFLFFVYSVIFFIGADWQDIDIFYEFINRILILVVGIELAKLLITHDLYTIGDLLAFIVARKMLTPDLSALDILLAVVAFSIIYVTNTLLRDRAKLASN